MAYSPSKVIRGVLAVLLEKANTLSKAQRGNFDFEGYLSRCQLERYLSQSRGNGIKSVITKLKCV
jgi:cysteine desulfuration protein SufE